MCVLFILVQELPLTTTTRAGTAPHHHDSCRILQFFHHLFAALIWSSISLVSVVHLVPVSLHLVPVSGLVWFLHPVWSLHLVWSGPCIWSGLVWSGSCIWSGLVPGCGLVWSLHVIIS